MAELNLTELRKVADTQMRRYSLAFTGETVLALLDRVAELEAVVGRVEALADGYGESGTGVDVANAITSALAGDSDE